MSDSVPGNPVWLLARFFDLEGELGLAKTLVRSKNPHVLHEKLVWARRFLDEMIQAVERKMANEHHMARAGPGEKSLERLLHQKITGAYNRILEEVQEEYSLKALEEFRRRFGRELATWALSTTSRVSLTTDQRELVVTIKLPENLWKDNNPTTVKDAVLGKPES